MSTLADEAEKLATLKAAVAPAKEAHDEAKAAAAKQEDVVLATFKREKQESCRPLGLGITFTAVFDKERGRLTDRTGYYDWALENEPSLQEFVDRWMPPSGGGDFVADLHEALKNLTILKLAERQELLNRQVRAAHEDGQPMPPGLDFDPVPYVSVTKA